MTATALPRIPSAPKSIQKGVPLKLLLGAEAVDCLADNIALVYPQFERQRFRRQALDGLDNLELMQRGRQIAAALYQSLPGTYAEAVAILLASLTPAQAEADSFGLAEFFYLPHGFFVADYGRDPGNNGGEDPFSLSMTALHALTSRFTAEFAIRPFLIAQQDRTLACLANWTDDPNPHVRRLCSEGSRPRLPWGMRLPALLKDPTPTLPLLEALKHDGSLYVRRSVANHLADIAKDHPQLAFDLCECWLAQSQAPEIRWLIRHALRHPAKKGNAAALDLRARAR